jgi:hypothetical protein
MTRDEFDHRYAATQDNTEGFTDAELERINDAVFAEVSDLELEPWSGNRTTSDHVQNMMDRKLNSYSWGPRAERD